MALNAKLFELNQIVDKQQIKYKTEAIWREMKKKKLAPKIEIED